MRSLVNVRLFIRFIITKLGLRSYRIGRVLRNIVEAPDRLFDCLKKYLYFSCVTTDDVSCSCYCTTLHSYITNRCVLWIGSFSAEFTHRGLFDTDVVHYAFNEHTPGIESSVVFTMELTDKLL